MIVIRLLQDEIAEAIAQYVRKQYSQQFKQGVRGKVKFRVMTDDDGKESLYADVMEEL